MVRTAPTRGGSGFGSTRARRAACSAAGLTALLGMTAGARAQWTPSGTDIVNTNSGEVGIGVINPLYKLHVATGDTTRTIFAHNSGATGERFGGYFASASTDGRGILGWATAASGTTYGVMGRAASPTGAGVFGWASAAGGRGVYGLAANGAGGGSGVLGQTHSPSGAGVSAVNVAVTGVAYGLNAITSSVSGIAVNGEATSASGATMGGRFMSNGGGGTGVAGFATSVIGSGIGVSGSTSGSTGSGVYGSALSSHGITFGGQFNSASTSGRAVFGSTTAPSGVTFGGFFQCASTDARAVFATSTAASGVTYGVWGRSASPNGYGVYGESNPPTGSNFAVFAAGRSGASGTKSFRIDHPLDPANRFLSHYCAEGPEPLNVYSGTVELGAGGEAWVQLPEYFGAINRDPRYQLTCIGGYAPVYIGHEVQNNAFRIAGGFAGLRVSWEVKAVRNDAFVRTHGAPVEEDKPAALRGAYQHPELHRAP